MTRPIISISKSYSGEACLLNVVHTEKDGNTYANIAGASPLPRGMSAPKLFNKAKLIDIHSVPLEEIDALRGFLREKMKSSEGVREARLRPPAIAAEPADYPIDDINPDDVPF